MARKKATRYEKRAGFRLNGDAQAIGERLEKLTDKNGNLYPDVVVKDAENPESPLHGEFEWDDTEAARRYRLEQARYITRAYTVIRVDMGQEIQHRPFVSLDNEDAPYTSVRKVLTVAQQRDQWLAQAIEDLRRWTRKYEDIRDLIDIYEDIEKVTQPT